MTGDNLPSLKTLFFFWDTKIYNLRAEIIPFIPNILIACDLLGNGKMLEMFTIWSLKIICELVKFLEKYNYQIIKNKFEKFNSLFSINSFTR